MPGRRIGLISDTHGFLDPSVPNSFRQVDHIIHAGDIGPAKLIAKLEKIAPVTAVCGNTDSFSIYPETATIDCDSTRILVQHIVQVDDLRRSLIHPAALERAQVLVFGHTHQSHCQRHEGILCVNPGYSGRTRRGIERSIATLTINPRNELSVEFIELH